MPPTVMKLVRITGSDCSDDTLLILAPATMTDAQIEQAVSAVVLPGIENGTEAPDMLGELVEKHGFVLIAGEYQTEVSWVEG